MEGNGLFKALLKSFKSDALRVASFATVID